MQEQEPGTKLSRNKCARKIDLVSIERLEEANFTQPSSVTVIVFCTGPAIKGNVCITYLKEWHKGEELMIV